MEDRGLEHTANSPGKTHVSESGGAESGAVDAENGPIDPDLQHIIIAWPHLSEDVRETVIRTVNDAMKAAR